MQNTAQQEWEALLQQLNTQFEADLDLDGVIFLVGLQELGMGYQKLSKDQKVDVMHVGICALLMPYGYYEHTGHDEDGWPHFERKKKLPPLSGEEQELLMKQAILDYFS